jgi:glycosyltransferase involved in cell wall biosynthesis
MADAATSRIAHYVPSQSELAATLVSVVVPCYNERATIRKVVDRLLAAPFHKEVLIVDDGSTDGTRAILADEIARLPGVRVILQERNKGKGAALRAGFEGAIGGIIIIQDADLEYDPSEIPEVIAPILAGDADVVYGSRFLGGPHRVLFFWHSVGNRVLTTISNMVTDLNLTDMETCYKAFRREVLTRITLREDRFGFEPEVTVKVARNKSVRIFEVPVSYRGRTYAEGKKIGFRDGFRALYVLARYGIFERQ